MKEKRKSKSAELLETESERERDTEKHTERFTNRQNGGNLIDGRTNERKRAKTQDRRRLGWRERGSRLGKKQFRNFRFTKQKHLQQLCV